MTSGGIGASPLSRCLSYRVVPSQGGNGARETALWADGTALVAVLRSTLRSSRSTAPRHPLLDGGFSLLAAALRRSQAAIEAAQTTEACDQPLWRGLGLAAQCRGARTASRASCRESRTRRVGDLVRARGCEASTRRWLHHFRLLRLPAPHRRRPMRLWMPLVRYKRLLRAGKRFRTGSALPLS